MNSQNSPYANPFGTWEVTTEGDVEGRSTTRLGIFTGFVDEIALHLANRVCYSLCFRAKKEQPKTLKPTGISVVIHFDIDSKTWDMSPDERVSFAKEVFRDRPVQIDKATTYAGFTISVPNKEEIAKEILRKNALKKLTDEEKTVLGLNLT